MDNPRMDKRTKAEILSLIENQKLAMFDSRVFTIPDPTEVENYFIWRQQDCVRNSIQSVAQSLYSHKELHKKNSSDLQEMIFQKGINWNDYDAGLKRGRMLLYIPDGHIGTQILAGLGNGWHVVGAYHFTEERGRIGLKNNIPRYN